MNTTLLNNRTKFGAKIFNPYRVITFLVLGHFFSRTLYTCLRAGTPASILVCLHNAQYLDDITRWECRPDAPAQSNYDMCSR